MIYASCHLKIVQPGRPKLNPVCLLWGRSRTRLVSPSPSLRPPSDPGPSVHLVRGDDVRLHHRAAVLAGGGDDLLLQEDRCSRGGGAEGERVSNTHGAQARPRLSGSRRPVQLSRVPTDGFHSLFPPDLCKTTVLPFLFLAELKSVVSDSLILAAFCFPFRLSHTLSFLSGPSI